MRKLFFLAVVLYCTSALASSCRTGDQLLQNNTPLTQLCPQGFKEWPSGSLSNAMQNQQNNTAMITASAENYGVPSNLALAVAYSESGFNSCDGSYTGVKGPMQLTQSTGRSLGFNRDINEQNINGGMAVLSQAYKACGGSNYACLASRYNGSNPTQQAQWARHVATADKQLQNNPQLLASACGAGSCGGGQQGDFPLTAPSTDTALA